MTDERFSLKDHLFNEAKVGYLADLLKAGVPDFDRSGFVRSVMSELPDLELKQRIQLIARQLAVGLSNDFEVAAEQIRRSLPPPLDPSLTDDDFGDFIFAPLGVFVAEHGLDHYQTSMRLLKELTKRFSMEGPIRTFLVSHQEETLALYEDWARDDNYHVRRLVSESTRPALPWAPRIDLPIGSPLHLLDILHADPTRYVTRSVANHLNDVSKIEPDLVYGRIRTWRQLGMQQSGELDWITRHSLRTLIKRGDPTALELLGYSPEPAVAAEIMDMTPRIQPGDTLEFAVLVQARSDVRLMVDYVIDFVKKSGAKGPKTFKLKNLTMQAGETRVLQKRHPIRANATTYTLYPGTHAVTIVGNGKPLATGGFELIDTADWTRR